MTIAHRIKCPGCGSVLSLKRPVQQATITCPQCKKAFTGTSTQVVLERGGEAAPPSAARPTGTPAGGRVQRPAKPAAPASADPAAPSAEEVLAAASERNSSQNAAWAAPAQQSPPANPYYYYMAPPPRRTNWPVVIGTAGIVAILGITVGIWYLSTHCHVQTRDKDYGWMLNEDAARLQEALKKAAEEPAPAPPARETERRSPSREPIRPVEGGAGPVRPIAPPKTAEPVTGDARPIRPGERYESGGFAEPITEGDTKIVTMGVDRVKGSIEGSGSVVGSILNKHDYALAGLDITVTAKDANGRMMASMTAKLAYVPAGATVPFSAKYADLTNDDFVRLETSARGAKADPTVVCWMIGDLNSPEFEKQVVIFRGKTVNETGAPVKNVKIYCDLFDKDNVWVGSAEGILDENITMIQPGKTAHFIIRFDTADKQILKEAVHHAVARLVGKKYSS